MSMYVVKLAVEALQEEYATEIYEFLSNLGEHFYHLDVRVAMVKVEEMPTHTWKEGTCEKCGDDKDWKPDKYCSEVKLTK